MSTTIQGLAVATTTAAPGRLALPARLTAFAVAASVLSAATSLARPSLLRGAAVTDGNLRGTALVVVVAAVPVVVTAARSALRGSATATVAWLAGLMFLGYQGVLFCFGTPVNRLFPAYVAMLGLTLWAAATLVLAVDRDALSMRLAPHTRTVPVLVGGLAVLNAAAWLGRALPVAWTGVAPDSVTQSGLDTSPVLVQDLAFWLPLALVAAILSLRGRAWALLVTPALLLFWALEGLSVASDQWFGVRADDSVPAVASLAAVPVGLGLAAALALVWVRWRHGRKERR